MIAWSTPIECEIPSGPLDLYQSIQRLEPGAWVAAHTHEGSESGVVVTAALARYERDALRTFAAGENFWTPAGVVHATGNPFPVVAEAITLHVVRAGSAFSTPCACHGAPPSHPGSSNPARSIVRDIELETGLLRAQHARIVLDAAESVTIDAATMAIVTLLAGTIHCEGEPLDPTACHITRGRSLALTPATSSAEVVVTRLESV
jgi:hypothetical protein